MTTYYTCGTSRDVRGNCGHRHRTEAGAEECCRRDQRGCASQGGYSDRSVRKIVDGVEVSRECDDAAYSDSYAD